MPDPVLQSFVEASLGCRIVRVRKQTEYTTGIQRQWLRYEIKKGKRVEIVDRVAPSNELELKMFDMLCTPQSKWGLPDGS